MLDFNDPAQEAFRKTIPSKTDSSREKDDIRQALWLRPHHSVETLEEGHSSRDRQAQRQSKTICEPFVRVLA